MARNDPIRAYLAVQNATDAELRRLLERAAQNARAQMRRLPAGTGGDVRRAQLERVIRSIKTAQNGLWTDTAGVIVRGRAQAITAAQDAADALTHQLYARMPERSARAVERGLNEQAAEGMRAERARTSRTLSRAVIGNRRGAQAKVEQVIRSGIVRGLSADELAGELYDLISPTVPGGVSYAAMRLARTEINNAFHNQQRNAGNRPGVVGIKWNLSDSHKVPDQCNVYATRNGGVFKVGQVPDKPHPHCFCFLTYEMAAAGDLLAAFENGDFDALLGGEPRLTSVPSPVERTGRTVPNNDRIRRSVESGEVSSEKLAGGVSAETSKVTFKDGTVGVRKVIDKRQQDAEELVPLLARMMGLNAPEVTRIDENTTVQEFLPGNVAMSALPWLINAGTPQAKKLSASARVKSYLDSDDGWLMAVMDQVTGNQDRHDGNWLVGENEGEIAGVIDHGLAYQISDWRTSRHDRMGLDEAYIFRTRSEFTKRFAKSNGEQTNIDFHPEDLDAIKEMMTALRPEYESRGRLDWWEFSMKQIEALRPFAKGKKRRIK